MRYEAIPEQLRIVSTFDFWRNTVQWGCGILGCPSGGILSAHCVFTGKDTPESSLTGHLLSESHKDDRPLVIAQQARKKATMTRRSRIIRVGLGALLAVITAAWVFAVPILGEVKSLSPIRSFPIPAFPDPDTNVNALAFADGRLFALNNFWNPATNDYEAKIYTLDSTTGAILNSFSVPYGLGLASDGDALYMTAAAPVAGNIVKLDSATGSVLATLHPFGATSVAGIGGLAFLDGDLFQVAATDRCGGVSVSRINGQSGAFLSCFTVDALGYDRRALNTDGWNLLYGTRRWDDPPDLFTVYTISTTGVVLESNVLTSVSSDINGLACGDNQLFVADRKRQEIAVFPFSCPAIVKVTVDVKPNSFPNTVNPNSKERVPVAVLTTRAFDAATLDQAKIRFGASGIEASPVQSSPADLDGDGDTDMLFQFRTQDTGIHCDDTAAKLTGETYSGQIVEGTDSINAVGCKLLLSDPPVFAK